MPPVLTPYPRKAILLLSLLLTLTAVSAFADQVTDIIEKTGAFYADQASLSANVDVELEMPPQFDQGGGMPPLSYHYYFRSPNSLAMVASIAGMMPPIIQDGKTYFSEMPMFGISILRDAFELEALLSEKGQEYIQLPGANILIGLGLGANVKGSLRSMTGARLLGSEFIKEIDCHHLKIESDGFTGEIWIAKGDKPWVLRVKQPTPELKPDDSEMMMMQPGLDLNISEWDTSPDFGDIFTISPNPDLKTRETMPSMEEFMALMGQGGGPGGGPEGPHASIGTPAPNLILKTMENGAVSLTDLKGKVVVLDFWATWCKPCVMALPLVTKVTDELENQGVVFYAVNQMESEAQVKSFLKDIGMDFAVALDKEGAAGQAFGVTGIPHSVVIDKNGVIRKVHVGFGPGMDKLLKQEIQELLAE